MKGRRFNTPSLVLLFFAAYVEAAAGAQSWTTAPDHRIDAPGRAEGVFGEWSSMRIGGSGTRVVVRDAEIVEASPVWRILVFSPEGELVATVAPEDFPGGFGPPRGLRAVADGFWTRHFEASLKHSYDGGDIVETIRYPAAVDDLSPTPLDEGGFLGLGGFPDSGEPPVARAVLRLALAGDDWQRDTIGVIDIRHTHWFVTVRSQSSRDFDQLTLAQPFSDEDLFWIDPGTGSVGIVRRNGPPRRRRDRRDLGGGRHAVAAAAHSARRSADQGARRTGDRRGSRQGAVRR